MSKVKKEFVGQYNGVYSFYCPGCGTTHLVNTVKGEMWNAAWSFNNDAERPTFSPSIKVAGRYWNGERYIDKCCHSFIRVGKIQYLTDCTHHLAGQTVEMVDVS
jgi:hypothetical protein